MAEGFYNLAEGYLIGSSTGASSLTADYGDNNAVVSLGGSGEIVLFITYTPAQNGRKLIWKLQGSNDNSDFYQLPIFTKESDGERAIKLLEDYFGEPVVASTAYKVMVPYAVNAKYFRISFKEDGSSNFGTIAIKFKSGSM